MVLSLEIPFSSTIHLHIIVAKLHARRLASDPSRLILLIGRVRERV
jgi:hypothetical protein